MPLLLLRVILHVTKSFRDVRNFLLRQVYRIGLTAEWANMTKQVIGVRTMENSEVWS